MANTVLMKGNEALAEAAIQAGCRFYFGYPITPQTEIGAYLAKRMPEVGGVFLQAESEIAAIHMVYGASAAGKRAMTSSSSPGVSLKSEGLSYLAGSDLPALVVNVQRAGPGLGGIQPSQSDYFQATRGGGHGDFRNIVLAPASVQEMYSLTIHGFDLADRYSMTAMILADGTVGQMMEQVSLETVKPIACEKPWALTGTRGEREKNIITSLYLAAGRAGIRKTLPLCALCARAERGIMIRRVLHGGTRKSVWSPMALALAFRKTRLWLRAQTASVRASFARLHSGRFRTTHWRKPQEA
jgi:2-oxoglutarate ferredoxin oxidoreductase subunit alpha